MADPQIDTNLPGAYQQQQTDAEAAYQQALTNIAAQQAQLAHDTGFTYQQNEDGSVSNMQIDPNNQYSNVMGLLGGHASSLSALRNGLASQGLTTGTGLAGKRQALMKFVQQGETSNLGANFLSKNAALFSQRAGAKATENNAFTSAEQAGLLYALQNQLFNTAQTPAGASNGNDTQAGGNNAGQPVTGKAGSTDAWGNFYTAPPSQNKGTGAGPQTMVSEHGNAGMRAQNTYGTSNPRQQLIGTVSRSYNGQAARNSY